MPNADLVDDHRPQDMKFIVTIHNPPHPGEIIRKQYIELLGLTVTAAAKGFCGTPKALSLLPKEIS